MNRFLDTFKPFIPAAMKSGMPQIRTQIPYLYRKATAKKRLLPDFLIIGAQRSGTTSLYNYMIQHPAILSSFRKEVHFFDLNFVRGLNWYRTHFPAILRRDGNDNKLLTGEATPYYLFHPWVAKRVFETLPQVKLIVLLRNPVDRAYSHYNHCVRRGYENVSFENALKRESDGIESEKQKLTENGSHISYLHQHHSYLSRGLYIDQLENWLNFFPKKQLLILKSEDFYKDPPGGFKLVTKFLELPAWELKTYKKFQAWKYPDLDMSLRKRLTQFFEPHNQRLYEYLGRDFNWR